MERLFRNDYISIYFDSDRNVVQITWLPDNQCMSQSEFLESIEIILNHIKSLQAKYFLFDAFDFNYRITSEFDMFFSEIIVRFNISHVAIIMSKMLLGKLTLKHVIKDKPALKILRNRKSGYKWIESKKNC